MQLKQNLNEVVEENVRLKTKISILEKEKDKMNRYIDSTPEALANRGGNSRMQLFATKSNEVDPFLFRNKTQPCATSKR